MNISFVGFGSIAKAIAAALSEDELYNLSAAAPSLTPGFNQNNIRTHYDNKTIVEEADVIILAVKAGIMDEVLRDIAPVIPAHAVVVSVATGLNLNWFAQRCAPNQAIVRAMPNTAAAIGLSATPLIANLSTQAQQKLQVELIFKRLGITTWTEKEEDMESFTALSGSGPAYVFLFMEAMVEAGVALGLDEKIAKQFALQTCQGACVLAQSSPLSLKELRDEVTSPQGTTAAALNILNKHLNKLLMQAMQAAHDRAVELSHS